MQVFLKIEVTLGALGRAKFAKITLLRADVEKGGAPGSFSPIADLQANQLTYDDYTVEPGKFYAYMVSTEVAIDGDPKEVELPAEEVKKDSPPLVLIAAVPYDFAIQILSATGQNPTTGAPASLTGEVSFWDYTTSKLVKVSKPKWAEHEKFGTKDRYEIFLIDDGKVKINDLTKRGAEKESLTSQNNRRPVDLPPELTPASATEKPAEPEEPKKAAPKKAEPEEKKAAGAAGGKKAAEGSKDKSKTKDAKAPDKKKRIVK
jgi:hypothetical protein